MAKQYLIFQRGRQPTETEIALLNSFRREFGGYNVGKEDKTGWLAFEFDGKKFEEACAKERKLDDLLTGWREKGCIRRPQLKFTLDEKALRPKPPPEPEPNSEPAKSPLYKATEIDVRESLGLAGLASNKRQRQMAAFGSASKLVVPGIIVGAIALAIFGYFRIQEALKHGGIQSMLKDQKQQVDDLVGGNEGVAKENPVPSVPVEKVEAPAANSDAK